MVGTNNGGAQVNGVTGSLWGHLVQRIETYVTTPPSYADKVNVEGGMDMEVEFNTPDATKAWANAYDANSNSIGYENYGDCTGCPQTQTYDTMPAPPGAKVQAAGISYVWYQDDIYDLSWGIATAFPLPEIYNETGANAAQWQNISLYAAKNYGGLMHIDGAVTQYQACIDQNDPCAGTHNTPAQGWTQLYNALNGDSHTAQDLPWSTDFTYQG